MTGDGEKDPIPFADDPNAPESLRAALGEARAYGGPRFDDAASLSRLKSAISKTATPVAGPGAGTSSMMRFVVVGGVVVMAAAVAMLLWKTQKPDAPPPRVSEPTSVAPQTVSPNTTTTTVVPAVEPSAASIAQAASPAPSEAPLAGSLPAAPVAHATRPPAPSPIIDEITLVRRARALLEANPREALTVARTARRAFPHGTLVEERDAIEVFALARLGRAPEARAAATRFLATYPQSPYAPRARAVESSGEDCR